MDEIDRANALADLMAEHTVAKIRQAANGARPAARPTGLCLWCGYVVTDHARWCDAECRDDWEHAHVRSR